LAEEKEKTVEGKMMIYIYSGENGDSSTTWA
jgi:hypothetical protein